MRTIMKIKHFDTLPEDAVFIRKEVFVKEQGFKNEFDEKDNEAHFLVGYENGSPVATCRIFYDTAKSIYIFGRIAVLKPYRGTGLGSLLLTEAQSYVTAKNAAKIGISAQMRAAGFYETLGFVRQGEEYLEENCPHIYMEKTL